MILLLIKMLTVQKLSGYNVDNRIIRIYPRILSCSKKALESGIKLAHSHTR
jgi:hypothetical protein